jgi:hypothetical protein
MKKTGFILAVAGFVTVVSVTFHAHAQRQQEGLCPNGNWDVINVNDADDPHQARIIDKEDGEQDHLVCAKKRGQEQVVVDNDVPFP